jgi:hypothetical protein
LRHRYFANLPRQLYELPEGIEFVWRYVIVY